MHMTPASFSRRRSHHRWLPCSPSLRRGSASHMQTKFDAVPLLEGFTNAFSCPSWLRSPRSEVSGSGDHFVGERSRFFIAREDGPRQPQHKDGYLRISCHLAMTDIPREASTHLYPGIHRAGASGGGAGGGNGCEQFALPRGSLLLTFANLDHCGAARGNHARVFAYVEMVEADGEMYKLSESKLQQGVQTFASEEHKNEGGTPL